MQLQRAFHITDFRAEPDGTYDASLASSTPVVRDNSYGRYEILSFEPGAIDLKRAKDGMPLLWNHDHQKLIGRAQSVTVDGEKLRAKLKFFDTPEGRNAKAAVDAGHREVSIGYSVLAVKPQQPDMYIVSRWAPHEASVVSVPADHAVGIGRSMKGPDMKHNSKIELNDQTPSKYDPISEANDIRAIAMQFRTHEGLNSIELAENSIAAGETRQMYVERLFARFGSRSKPTIGDLGIRPQELAGYSVARAVQSLTDPAAYMKHAGLEREVSQELQRNSTVKTSGILVPFTAIFGRMHRNLQARGLLTTGDGGSTVQSTIDGSMFIDVLRAKSQVVALGARVLTGLTDNVSMPRKTAATLAGWLDETTTAGVTNPTFDNVTLTPRRIGAYTDISRQLMIQSSLDMENIITADLGATILQELDRVAVFGTGSNHQPRGIANTTGIGTIVGGSNGAALNYGHIVGLERAVADQNAMLDMASSGYLINPATRAWLKQTPKVSGQLTEAIMGDECDGAGMCNLNSYRCAVSTKMPNTGTKGNASNLSTLVFADWSQLVIGQFGGGLELIVDQYSLAREASIRIVANLFVDLAVRHPESFAVMTDAKTA